MELIPNHCTPLFSPTKSITLIHLRWKLSCFVHGLRSTIGTTIFCQRWLAIARWQKEIIERLFFPLHGGGGRGANGHVTVDVSGERRVFADAARRIDFKSRGRGDGFVKNGFHAGIGFAARASGFQESKFVDHQSVPAVSGGCFATESVNGCQFDIVRAQAI